MLAVFMSVRPYVCFKPNLQHHDDYLSIWEHELFQSDSKGLTIINLERLRKLDLKESSRGVPIDFDDALSEFLIDMFK
jgi:hypothetical protein